MYRLLIYNRHKPGLGSCIRQGKEVRHVHYTVVVRYPIRNDRCMRQDNMSIVKKEESDERVHRVL